MKFHGVDMVGKFFAQEVSTLPTWTSSDVRRIIYVTNEDTYYFGGATQWIQLGTGSGGGGISGFSTTDFSFDADDNGSSAGVAFNLIPCVDFRYDVDGKIIVSFPAESFNADLDIKFKIQYNLNGSDNSKGIVFETKYWCVEETETPNYLSADGTYTDTITSSATNTGKMTELLLTNGKVPNASITENTKQIVIAFTRLSTDVSDTYGGTFQLINVIPYQE